MKSFCKKYCGKPPELEENQEDTKMKKLVGRFGKFIAAAFIIMGVGIILFLLTPLLIRLFNFDSDIFGVMIFIIGLIMCAGGFMLRWVRRNKQVR